MQCDNEPFIPAVDIGTELHEHPSYVRTRLTWVGLFLMKS